MHQQVTAFLAYADRERNFSGHTVVAYKNDLEHFDSFVKRMTGVEAWDPAAVDRGTIRAFLASLLEQGYSRRSIARSLACLRSFFKYLRRSHRIRISPTTSVASPRLERRLPRFLDESTMHRLMDQPDRGTPEGARDAAVLEFLYSTGIRLSELI